MKEFAKRVKELRLEKHGTQRAMAEYFGVSLRQYQYYESAGHYPDVAGLIAMADYFGVSTDYLLGRSEERK